MEENGDPAGKKTEKLPETKKKLSATNIKVITPAAE